MSGNHDSYSFRLNGDGSIKLHIFCSPQEWDLPVDELCLLSASPRTPSTVLVSGAG